MKKNFFFSGVSNFFKFFSGIALVLIYARVFTTEQFGDLGYALIVAVVVGQLIDFGYNVYLPKETASEPDAFETLVSKGLALKLVLSITALALLVICYQLGWVSGEFSDLMIFGVSAVFLSLGNLFLLPYRSLNRFEVESKYTMIYHIMLSVTVIGVVLLSTDLMLIGLAFLFCRVVFCWLSYRHYRREFKLLLPLNSELLGEAKGAAPYAVHALIGTLLMTLDTLILRLHVDSELMGIYRAGMHFIVASTIFMVIFYDVLLPKFTLGLKGDRANFLTLVRRYNWLVISIGAAGSLVFYGFADWIVWLAFGENMQQLVQYVPLLALLIFLRFFGVTYNTLLTCSGNQVKRSLFLAITLVFVVMLEFYLIPLYQLKGALYSLIAGHILLYSLTMLMTYKEFGTFFLFPKKEDADNTYLLKRKNQ